MKLQRQKTSVRLRKRLRRKVGQQRQKQRKEYNKEGKEGAIDVKMERIKRFCKRIWRKSYSRNVTVSKKTMTAIDVVSAPGETDSFFQRAKGVIDEMLTAQSTDVDVVSEQHTVQMELSVQ